jgi:hypothetical protein
MKFSTLTETWDENVTIMNKINPVFDSTQKKTPE